MSILSHKDPEVAQILLHELKRQQDTVELIASENFVSLAVLQAQGSVLTNKYAEGLPGKRYYGGCEFVDCVENLAIERVTRLFKCRFANVQPHSGSQANQAVFLALLQPGDVVMGMDLSAGGHLTHGSSVSLSGKWFRACSYGVSRETNTIDYDEVEKLAQQHRPKLIIAGGSAYPRIIDFKRFRMIADSIDAFLLVDMAHFAGLVATELYPSPFPHAHVVTSTTHKTLRGPRGGIILSDNEDIAKKINSAVFPGLQGGPLMHVIAAKAVAFGEALHPSFETYAHNIIANAQALSSSLIAHGLAVITGGTDSNLLLVDLRETGMTGKEAEHTLERIHITCNKNGIPFDPLPPSKTSGIRLGTPAMTTRGFTADDFRYIGTLIAQVLQNPDQDLKQLEENVLALCHRYPLYPELG